MHMYYTPLSHRPQAGMVEGSISPLAYTKVQKTVSKAVQRKHLRLRLALQRNLCIIGKFVYASSPVGQVGAMVSGLDPKDLFDQAFHGVLFHW